MKWNPLIKFHRKIRETVTQIFSEHRKESEEGEKEKKSTLPVLYKTFEYTYLIQSGNERHSKPLIFFNPKLRIFYLRTFRTQMEYFYIFSFSSCSFRRLHCFLQCFLFLIKIPLSSVFDFYVKNDAKTTKISSRYAYIQNLNRNTVAYMFYTGDLKLTSLNEADIRIHFEIKENQ